MTEIFVHKDYTLVGFYRSILQEAGIPCFIRNENTHHAFSELPIPALYPALTVMHDEDAERAVALLREFRDSQPAPGEDWICPECQEQVPAGFGSCWNCEEPRPFTASPDTPG